MIIVIAALLTVIFALEHKSKHFDLGISNGLRLTLDLEIDIEYSAPFRFLYYKAHFYAQDTNGSIVDEKFVDLGETSDNPRALILEDRFRQGYKQFFISFHLGSTQSYLFAFRNGKFYTAFINNRARVGVRALPGKPGTWVLEESEARKWAGRVERKPNVRITKSAVYTTWLLNSRSNPIIEVQYPEKPGVL